MLLPEDAINRRELCELFRVKTEGKSASAISDKGEWLAKEHKLTQWPDPAHKTRILYSRAEAMKVWAKLQPLTRKAA